MASVNGSPSVRDGMDRIERLPKRKKSNERRIALRAAAFCCSVFVGAWVDLAVLKSPFHMWLMAAFQTYISSLDLPLNLVGVLLSVALGGLFMAIPGVIGLLAGWLCWRLLGRYGLKTPARKRRTELTAYRTAARVIVLLVERLDAASLSRPFEVQLKADMETAVSKIDEEFQEDDGLLTNASREQGEQQEPINGLLLAYGAHIREISELTAERDRLKAQLDEARRDAERCPADDLEGKGLD